MPMDNSALALLAVALLVSLIIERLLEFAKAFYNYFELKRGWILHWNKRAEKVQKQLHDFWTVDDEILKSETASKRKKAQALARKNAIKLLANRLKVDGPGYENGLSVSARKVRRQSMIFAGKVLGIVLGILVAFAAQIDIFKLIEQMIHVSINAAEKNPMKNFTSSGGTSTLREYLNYTLTGIAMGLGAGPLHSILVAMERIKKRRIKNEIE